jgi:hypothetical protein
VQVDHGGLGPPAVNPSHDPNNTTSASLSTKVECYYDDYDEILRQFRKSLLKIDESMKRLVVPWKPLERTPGNKNAARQVALTSNYKLQQYVCTTYDIIPPATGTGSVNPKVQNGVHNAVQL